MPKIEDWDAWMQQHHVKLGGKDEDDGRTDERTDSGGIFGARLENESQRHAGQSGNSHI